MYTSETVNDIQGVASCVAVCIWAAYFIFSEPERRQLTLPSTSPFLRWNQISMALGDAPGYVALGGVQFASAELEVMRRASEKMASDR